MLVLPHRALHRVLRLVERHRLCRLNRLHRGLQLLKMLLLDVDPLTPGNPERLQKRLFLNLTLLPMLLAIHLVQSKKKKPQKMMDKNVLEKALQKVMRRGETPHLDLESLLKCVQMTQALQVMRALGLGACGKRWTVDSQKSYLRSC